MQAVKITLKPQKKFNTNFLGKNSAYFTLLSVMDDEII